MPHAPCPKKIMDSITPNPNTNLPNFCELNYKIERELGHNRSNGRVTYLATNTQTQQAVVIKQFQFAKTGTTWSDYDAHEREIELLQQLNSSHIPKYLDAFETNDGFCLIQEYKKAPSLAVPQPFTPEEVQQIAIAALEILIYLQQQLPPIIHRDIKPENLLIERSPQIKVYLVDFGLARPLGGDIAASSMIKGTLGFMPPEQMFNRQLTAASDLYSLGATLICLLTQTKSTEIGNLMDEAYLINFKPLLPNLSVAFINWLEKMVAPSLKHRFPNAVTALAALEVIDVVGNTSKSGMELTNKIKSLASNLLLFKLALATALSASFMIGYKMAKPRILASYGDPIQQLQITGQCPRCNLKGANLRGLDLRMVDLKGADLRGADLRSSNLEGADLSNANLTNVDLRGAYLANAHLANAEIKGANLESADLRGATMPDTWRREH